jgi:hypothetical protein
MIPGRFPVRLHEVGISARGRAHCRERIGGPRGTLALGRGQQCPLDPRGIQAVNSDVSKQSF